MIKMPKNTNKGLHITVLAFVFAVLVCLLCGFECKAAESDVGAEVDGIIEDFKEATPESAEEPSDLNAIGEAVGIRRVLLGIIEVLKGEGSAICGFLLTLVGIALLSALASQSQGDTAYLASRAVLVVSSALLMERLTFLISEASDALSEMNGFFGAIIPIGAAINTLGVSPTTASGQAVGMSITLGIYSFITSKLLSGVVAAIFVSSAASAIDPLFGKLGRGVKKLFLTVMGILTALIGATFSLQSIITSSADSAVLRGTRYAISGTVPIVGSTVSGALGVVGGAVTYARGIVGGGAIAVILSLILAPAVTILAYRFCLRLGVFFSSLCSIDGSEGLMAPFADALDALFGVYALTAVLYVIELAAFLKGGASLA